jgi:hypothetical protein
MISYTDNSLPDGDFPSFEEMKKRHPDYQHFFYLCGPNGYQATVCRDEDISGVAGWMLDSFVLKEKEFGIYRYIYKEDEDENEEVVEKHFGAVLRETYTSMYFDTIEDAIKYITLLNPELAPQWGEYVSSFKVFLDYDESFTKIEKYSVIYEYDEPKLLNDLNKLRKDKNSLLSIIPKDIIDLVLEYFKTFANS